MNEKYAKISKRVRRFTEQSGYYHKGDPQVIKHKKELSSNKPLVAELFSGLGGTSMGFEMAGFETVLGLDIHKPSIQTFSEAHPTATSILGDIRSILNLDGNNQNSLLSVAIRERIGERQIDVLIAGIPCQGFSMSNRKRNEYDERNYMFFYFLEAVKLLNPKVVLLENVSGLKSLSNGKFALTIEHYLNELGYKTHHKILNAAEFGVPQKRRRVVFIGAKNCYIEFPKPLLTEQNFLTVKDAISDLPILGVGESSSVYDKSAISGFAKEMRGDSKTLNNHIAPNHPIEVIKRIDNTPQGQPMYPKFKQRIRLSWTSQSPTQVCGGIRPQFQFGHPDQPRGLSIRERARIQSIPDRVFIHGGVVQGRVQTGNAVPPLLAKHLALNIKKYLISPCFEYGTAPKTSRNTLLKIPQ